MELMKLLPHNSPAETRAHHYEGEGVSKDSPLEFVSWRNGTSFGLNDLEALVTVARQAKDWMAAHALKR